MEELTRKKTVGTDNIETIVSISSEHFSFSPTINILDKVGSSGN
eukprot:COSAG05_NODE_8361_length_711_cov_0.895425_2_plen_43_part_01